MRTKMAVLILLFITCAGCSFESVDTEHIPEPTQTKFAEQGGNIQDEILEVISSIQSFEDIEDSIILKYDSLFNSLDLRMTPAKDSIKIEVGEFTGVKYLILISADNDCSFELRYDGDFTDGQIVCIKSDQTVERFSASGEEESKLIAIPKGDNYIGIVGYKAAGTFSLTVEESEIISIRLENLF